MAFFNSFFGCFSNSSRVRCEDGVCVRSESSKAQSDHDAKSKSKSQKSPPIPMTYFPIGSTFSRL
ncbi:hypothetical protein ACSBR1_015265 [Camellia fascicularis]